MRSQSPPTPRAAQADGMRRRSRRRLRSSSAVTTDGLGAPCTLTCAVESNHSSDPTLEVRPLPLKMVIKAFRVKLSAEYSHTQRRASERECIPL